MSLPFEVAPLTAAHARAAHGLTVAVGWAHRYEDWLFALAIGRGLGAFDSAGALRGALMWFPYGEAFATICPSSEQTGRSEVSVNGGFGASRLSV